MTSIVLFLLVAYLIGAIPCGVVLTRLTGAGDVRKAGSGNIGATNVYRVAGRTLGVLTLLGDALKGLLPMLYVTVIHPLPDTQVGLVAIALFLGHCFPVYLGFKGGKGVATALGIYLIISPLSVAIAFILFAGLLWKWRYVSLSSISAAASIPALVWWRTASLPLFSATLVIAVLVIARHHSNIRRLLNGTENRFKA